MSLQEWEQRLPPNRNKKSYRDPRQKAYSRNKSKSAVRSTVRDRDQLHAVIQSTQSSRIKINPNSNRKLKWYTLYTQSRHCSPVAPFLNSWSATEKQCQLNAQFKRKPVSTAHTALLRLIVDPSQKWEGQLATEVVSHRYCQIPRLSQSLPPERPDTGKHLQLLIVPDPK